MCIKKGLAGFHLLFLFMLPVSLFGASQVSSVKVEGNRRVEDAAILNQILSKPGKTYSSKQIRESITNIYNMGYFEDIVVDSKTTSKGIVLTFYVQEKPAIRKIRYEGYKKLDLSDIRDVVDVRVYSMLDLNKIKAAREKIVKLYEQKGFFLAKATYRLEKDDKRNEVELIFQIEELDKVKIRNINFIGNKALDDDDLKSVMATKEKGFFSWMTRSDNYQEDVFKGDVDTLTYFYHTKGHVQVKIDSPVVTVSPDKKWIDIMVTIHEGQAYDIGTVDYSGELIFSRDELSEDRQLVLNERFNRDDLRLEVLRLADKYKDEGYAFANVNVRSNVREKERKVDLTFDFEKGQKVYFGKINIRGNTNTRDKVIRRELRIQEGQLYSETDLRKSIQRVQALGYFSEVNVTKPQGEDLDILDVNIHVTERSTGALTVGAGWSSVDSLVANAQISHNNLFGRGQTVSLDAQLAGKSSRFTFSFTEPYTLDTLWSSGLDAYKTRTETDDYTELKLGGDFRVGHPIGEYTNTYLTYKLEDLELDRVAKNSENLIQADGLVSSILSTFVYDRRNNRFDPSKGIFERISFEFAGVGGDNHFFKSLLNSRYYRPAFLGGVFRINAEIGILTRTTSQRIPDTERFRLGGITTIRGFESFTIGPKKIGSEGEAVVVGGNRMFFANVEYELPLLRSMGVKGVAFYDVGSSFNNTNITRVRQSVGFGLRWFSPFGPIRAEVGFPFNPEAGEEKSVFKFAITPPF